MLSIVENSHYVHEEYGRVQLDLHDETADPPIVTFHSIEETLPNSQFPKHWEETVETFRERAEPMDIAIDVPTATADIDAPAPGGDA